MGTAQSSAQKAVEKSATSSGDSLSLAFERTAVVEKSREFFADSPVKSSSAVAGAASNSFWNIDLFGLSQSHYAKVLFCGRDHFPSGFIYTKEALQNHTNIVVAQCDTTELATEIEDAHVVVPLMTKISRDLISKAPYLNLIMQFGVDLDGVDIDAATEAGVAVASIPSDQVGNAQSCAEHAIFLCLSLLRRTKVMEMSIVEGRLGVPVGRTIMGSSVMIFGFGGLGKELARRLFPFNPRKLVAVKRIPWIGLPPQKIDEVGTLRDLPRLLEGVDIVFICCSHNQSNLGVVNKSFIDLLNKHAIIVNIARVIKD
jgi:phosphoglycerate dehydrogenase-like enzyme